MKHLKISLLIGLGLILNSCWLDEAEAPNYTSDYLVPIVKTNITAESVAQLEDIVLLETVINADYPDWLVDTVQSLNYFPPFPTNPNDSVNVRGIKLNDPNNYYIKASADTAVFKVRVINDFPFDIKPGMIIVLQNDSLVENGVPNTDTVYEGIVNKTIPGNGGVVELELDFTNPDVDIANDFEMSLLNISSDGQNPVNSISFDDKLRVQFELVILRINEAELRQNVSYDLTDTSEFNFTNEDGVAEQIRSGTFSLFMTNRLPVNVDMQAYFINDAGIILDSMFQSSSITSQTFPPPTVNPATGETELTQVTEKEFIAVWDDNTISNLEAATLLVLKGNFRTISLPGNPNQPLIIRHENSIPFQLVGDFNVQIDGGN